MTTRSFTMTLALVLATVVSVACGDDDGGGSTDAGGSDAMRSNDATPADGMMPADAAPAPDSAVTPDTSTTPDAAVMPDTAPGEVAAGQVVHDCGDTQFAATDRTAAGDTRTVMFSGVAYNPKCMRIKAGQTVTWMGNFGPHPLAKGITNAATTPGVDSPGNPITPTTTGNMLMVTFPAAGTFAYFCTNHDALGMYGAIQVVP